MEELIVRIKNLLKEKTGDTENAGDGEARMGKYNFHFNRRLLSSDKTERKLSFRETELLKILYQNREKIIARKEILNLLWGNDSFFNSRNLDVYITKLRSYLKEDPSVEIITIKGVGYRFVAL